MMAYRNLSPATAMSQHCSNLRSTLHTGLSAEAQLQLNKLARIKSYRKGETIVAQTDDMNILGTVLSGVLRSNRTSSDGRHQIVRLLLPSDVFGRVYIRTSHVSIEAASDATVCTFDRQAIEKLMAQFPEIEHRMIVVLSQQLDAAHDWMLMIATQSVLERVAAFLLICRNTGLSKPRIDQLAVTVPISRGDMAAHLGTTIESICRALQSMKKLGVIRTILPTQIEIMNLDRLVIMSNCGLEDAASSLDDFEVNRDQGSERIHALTVLTGSASKSVH